MKKKVKESGEVQIGEIQTKTDYTFSSNQALIFCNPNSPFLCSP